MRLFNDRSDLTAPYVYDYICHSGDILVVCNDDYRLAVVSCHLEEKLKNLYALQSMLSEIDSIKTLRGELPLEVQDLEDEIEGMTTRIEKITADIAELKKEISERNGKIAENKTNIERYNTQMDSVRNNREYDSLTKQVEYAELDNQLHEKKIREAKEIVEAKNAEMTRCNLAVNERRVLLETKKEELEEIVSETKAEEEKLRERAKNLELTIEPRLLNAFKLIRRNSRNGLGIVSVPFSAMLAVVASTRFRHSANSTSAAARRLLSVSIVAAS